MRRTLILALGLSLAQTCNVFGQDAMLPIPQPMDKLGSLPPVQSVETMPPTQGPVMEQVGMMPALFSNSVAPTHLVWGSAEYLLWIVKHSPVPTPLITVGSAVDAIPGALGQPGTRVLYGGENSDLGTFSGGRFNLGFWLGSSHTVGVEGGYFFLERRTQITNASSDASGSPILATPVYNTNSQSEISYLTTAPGFAAGTTSVHNTSRLYGSEANLVLDAGSFNRVRTTFLAGYRNVQLAETLNLFQVLAPLAPFGVTGLNVGAGQANIGDTVSSFDRFGTHNVFNGGQIGARFDWDSGLVFVSLTSKIAIGNMHQIVDIDGASLLIHPNQSQSVVPGGIFALPSNMGSYSRDVFGFIPEVNLNMGINLTSHVRAFAGYSFLYISSVARPGNQIDRAVNVNQVPTDPAFGMPGGPARPNFSFHGSDYWAQGLSFGMELRY